MGWGFAGARPRMTKKGASFPKMRGAQDLRCRCKAEAPSYALSGCRSPAFLDSPQTRDSICSRLRPVR